MGEILEQALDIALDKKDPKRKLERRQARDRKQNASESKSSPDEIVETEPASSRYMASEVRERVCSRALATNASNKHATERGAVHEQDFRSITNTHSLYQSHDEQILRALCAAHNRLTAEHVYGSAFIQRKIDENKRARAP